MILFQFMQPLSFIETHDIVITYFSQLGIHVKETVPSIQESWNYLTGRLSYFFSSQVCSFSAI